MNSLWFTSEALEDRVIEAHLTTLRSEQLLKQLILNFLPPEPISGFNESNKFSLNFVADEAFPLKPHKMRSYPK